MSNAKYVRFETVLRPEEIRLLPPGRALVLAENAPPLIARLTRCLTGRRGAALLAAQAAARDRVVAARGCGTGGGERARRPSAATAEAAGTMPVSGEVS